MYCSVPCSLSARNQSKRRARRRHRRSLPGRLDKRDRERERRRRRSLERAAWKENLENVVDQGSPVPEEPCMLIAPVPASRECADADSSGPENPDEKTTPEPRTRLAEPWVPRCILCGHAGRFIRSPALGRPRVRRRLRRTRPRR